nr:T9SS type A sorting domain-containing protein [uncultured Sphingobacterium sp.]
MNPIFKVVIASLLIMKATNAGAQFYVDNATGVDAPGYGNISSPFKTISYAVKSAQLLDTTEVLIMPGSYFEQKEIYIYKNGFSLQRWGSGEVIIDGSNAHHSPYSDYLLAIVDANSTTIDGITFQNYIGDGYKGIYVLGSTSKRYTMDYVNINHCKFRNIGWVSDNLVDTPANSTVAAYPMLFEGYQEIYSLNIVGNEISNCATGWGEAISFRGDINSIKIDSNKIHHISNTGIGFHGSEGIAMDPSYDFQNWVTVTNNEIHHCMSGVNLAFGIKVDGGKGIDISTNILHDNGAGLSFGIESSTIKTIGSCRIYNNLIYKNSIAGVFLGSVRKGNFITNNGFYNNTLSDNSNAIEINGVKEIGGNTIAKLADNMGEICLFNMTTNSIMYNIFDASTGKYCMVAMLNSKINDMNIDYNLYNTNAGNMLYLATSINGGASRTILNTLPAIRRNVGIEQNGRKGDAAFIDKADHIYSLTPPSPAINMHGPNVYHNNLMKDFAGNQRIYGESIDAGAFEFQGQPTIIEQKNTKGFDLFPNPSHGFCYLAAPEESVIISICITDISGRLIKDYTGTPKNGHGLIPLELNGMNKGIYTVQILTNKKLFSQKLSIE